MQIIIQHIDRQVITNFEVVRGKYNGTSKNITKLEKI